MLGWDEPQPPRLFPPSPWLAPGSLARGCPPSPAPGGGSQMSRGRMAHGAAMAHGVPARLLPSRGKGEPGSRQPLIAFHCYGDS